MTNNLPQLKPDLLLGDALDTSKVWGMLSEPEKQAVSVFARGIDLSDPAVAQTYAAGEQGAMQTWLDVAVGEVAKQDLQQGEASIQKMLAHLRDWNRLCRPRRFLWFGGASYPRLQEAYGTLSPAVEQAAATLLAENVSLRRLSKLLERMRAENEEHLTRLTTYLLCGQLQSKALHAAGEQDALSAQAAVDRTQALARFDRRLHDLALTRQIGLQTRGQLALLLDGNERMIETMERTLRQTLPLWQAQVLLALGLSAQVQAQEQVLRARDALMRETAARTSLIARLLGRAQRGQQRIDRAKLQQQNVTLLDAVTAMQGALREQQRQEDALERALRAPAATATQTERGTL